MKADSPRMLLLGAFGAVGLLGVVGCQPAVEEDFVPVESVASEQVFCEDPERRAEDGPMWRAELGGDWSVQEAWEPSEAQDPRAIAVADFDGDARYDVLLPTGLFLATGGDGPGLRRADESFSFPVEDLPDSEGSGISGLTGADFDGDGDMDILASGEGLHLYRNDGGHFVEATGEVGLVLEEESGCCFGTAWGDHDSDGDLDLVAFTFGDEESQDYEAIVGGEVEAGLPSLLLDNMGDGRFEDRTERLPDSASSGLTCAGGWHDLDLDNRPDLYLVNDFGPQVQGNRLMRNESSLRFVDVTQELGVGEPIYGMGLGVGDVNGDGIPDLLASSWEEIMLLESASEGGWYRSDLARGLELGEGQHTGWGVELVDMDNDGDLDAPMAFGQLPFETVEDNDFLDTEFGLTNSSRQPDALFLQGEDGVFEDMAPEWGVDDDRDGMSFVPVDLNGDGWLDLVKMDRIWLSRCGAESWLRVRLHGPSLNHAAVGARLELSVGSSRQVRWIVAGSTGHGSSGPPEAHFGLGDLEGPARLVVHWPDGAVSSTDDVPINSLVQLVRENATAPAPPLPTPSF